MAAIGGHDSLLHLYHIAHFYGESGWRWSERGGCQDGNRRRATLGTEEHRNQLLGSYRPQRACYLSVSASWLRGLRSR